MGRYLIYSEVFPSEGPGIVRQTGVGRYCAELATGLADAGHDVTVLTNESQGQGLDPHSFVIRRQGSAPGGILSMMRRLREIRRAIAHAGAEFVIAGDVLSHKVLGAAAPRTARVLPVLYGSELRSFAASFSAGASMGRRVRQEFLRRYFERAFGTICISEFVARELQASPLGPLRHVIVHPAVRPLLLNRQPNLSFRLPGTIDSGTHRSVRLLTIGRISERKNQLQVLHSLAALRDQFGIRCEYYILGNVDADVHSPYSRAMRAFISAHHLDDQVFMLEGTSDEEKIDSIDACDVVIAVSRTAGFSTEGFGISAIEGSARGKPVIVSREGGMPETIVDGVTGFSVPANGEAQLSESIAALAGSPDLRNRMGQAGRELVLQRFTPKSMADSLTAWLSRELHAPPAVSACEAR
jgi:glycosyltransferase involved in cell wall biosynthesis